jgi:D-alanyl-D-alanine dipeptidase
MRDGDTPAVAATASAIVAGPRVTQFWDGARRLGAEVSRSLGERERVAWDIYLFYAAGAEWTDAGMPPPAALLVQVGLTDGAGVVALPGTLPARGDPARLPPFLRGRVDIVGEPEELAALLRELARRVGSPAPSPGANAARRPADIVDLRAIDPTIRVDLLYAGADNFVGARVDGYRSSTCYLTTAAARALADAQARLRRLAAARGASYSLLVRDCYRPQKAVAHFVRWSRDPSPDDATRRRFHPDLTRAELIEQGYIAPASGHSRASTVDLTIVALAPDGAATPLPMGTEIDFFGERAHTAHPALTAEERRSRDLLLEVMTPAFDNFAKEWWHFTLRDEPYPATAFDFDVVDPAGGD